VSLFSPQPDGDEALRTNRATDAVTVAFTQVYASHYLTACLSLTSITPAAAGSPRYLVYVRRSRVNVLGGTFAGIIRKVTERRIRSEAPSALDSLRRRLETEPLREPLSEALARRAKVVVTVIEWRFRRGSDSRNDDSFAAEALQRDAPDRGLSDRADQRPSRCRQLRLTLSRSTCLRVGAILVIGSSGWTRTRTSNPPVNRRKKKR